MCNFWSSDAAADDGFGNSSGKFVTKIHQQFQYEYMNIFKLWVNKHHVQWIRHIAYSKNNKTGLTVRNLTLEQKSSNTHFVSQLNVITGVFLPIGWLGNMMS